MAGGTMWSALISTRTTRGSNTSSGRDMRRRTNACSNGRFKVGFLLVTEEIRTPRHEGFDRSNTRYRDEVIMTHWP